MYAMAAWRWARFDITGNANLVCGICLGVCVLIMIACFFRMKSRVAEMQPEIDNYIAINAFIAEKGGIGKIEWDMATNKPVGFSQLAASDMVPEEQLIN